MKYMYNSYYNCRLTNLLRDIFQFLRVSTDEHHAEPSPRQLHGVVFADAISTSRYNWNN